VESRFVALARECALFFSFHQCCSHEDFVEGLRPVSDADGNVRYEVKPGVFKRLCRRAQQDPAHTYVLVIDEINQGNISKVCRGKTACGVSSNSASAS
jgi:5-methylcytosine-specific restriction endonuclease McrBC GTP-binding regulatory subunit McrB